MAPSNLNAPVEGVPFFAPTHLNSPGTPTFQQPTSGSYTARTATSSTTTPSSSPTDTSPVEVPTLFTPLAIRGATLRNRIVVAPMCQYSSAHEGPLIGALTPYHVATLGHYVLKGAALAFIEATGVQPNGRISPNCPGLWSDSQIDGVKALADFIHTQRGLCGIQLAHGGRKAGTVAPWLAAKFKKPSVRAGKDVGGWPDDVVGPTGGEEQTWDGRRSDDPDGGFHAPRELTEEEVCEVVRDWASAAERAVKAGVDVIEVHAAHGYLICEFLSPITNRRTDRYGGSFENRTRLLLEIVRAVRQVIPDSVPLFVRVSATEWMEETDLGKTLGSWDLQSTIELAKLLSDQGVDLLDVSSGGNHREQRINMYDSKDYQTRMAARIRQELRATNRSMLVGAVGLITQAEQARDVVSVSNDMTLDQETRAATAMTDAKGGKEPLADIVLVARQFMREPEWVLRVAAKLGIDIHWPSQFLRVRFAKL